MNLLVSSVCSLLFSDMLFILLLPQSSWKAVVLMNPSLHNQWKASKHFLEMNNRTSRLKFVLYFAESGWQC